VYDAKDVVPFSATLKFKLAMRLAGAPVTIAGIAILACFQQAGDTPNFVQAPKDIERGLEMMPRTESVTS
jgi:hypothetical protein